MYGNCKNLVKEKFGETSTTQDDVASNSKAITKLSTSWIFVVGDA